MYEREEKSPCYYCTPEEHAACNRPTCEKWIEWKTKHEQKREAAIKNYKKVSQFVEYDIDLNKKIKKYSHYGKWKK